MAATGKSNLSNWGSASFSNDAHLAPSPAFQRASEIANKNYFSYLLLLSFVSFGGHFARSSLSMFGLYFIQDNFISPAGLGMFLSASALPALFLPLLVGYLIDKTKQVKKVTMGLLGLTIAGLVLFSISVYIRSFELALLALVIFGSGASSITAIQRMLITVYIKGNETFTTGFYIALANIAKLLGKVTVGPTESALHSYQLALISPIIACTISFLSYLIFTWSYDDASSCVDQFEKHEPCSCKRDNVPCRKATKAMEEVLTSIDLVHDDDASLRGSTSAQSFSSDDEDNDKEDFNYQTAAQYDVELGDGLFGKKDATIHSSSNGTINNNGISNGGSSSSRIIIAKAPSYTVVQSGPSAALSFKKSTAADTAATTAPESSSSIAAAAAALTATTSPALFQTVSVTPFSTQSTKPQLDMNESSSRSSRSSSNIGMGLPVASEASSLLSVALSSSKYSAVDSISVSMEPATAQQQQGVVDKPHRSRTASACCCWRRSKNPMRKLPSMFFWYAAVHTLYIMIFHLLVNFIPHYAVLIWKQEIVEAGYTASIPSLMIIFLAPLVGGVVDRVGCSTLICALAALNTVVAYLLLLFFRASPLIIVAMLSFSQALIPALTLAEVSRIVPTHSVGIAFGVIEVLDSCVNLFGNVGFGMLYNITGSYDTGMCGLFLLSVVGFLLLLYLVIMEVRKQQQQQQLQQQQRQQQSMSSAGNDSHAPSVAQLSLLPRFSFIMRKEQSYSAI